jgi:anti-sigma factor RsiW
MTHDAWTERLSDYLDDEMSAGERSAVAAHLEGCEACRAWVEDVTAIRAEARALGDRPPASDLWPALAVRLEPPSRRSMQVPLPLAIAAGLFIAVSSALGAWVLSHRDALPVSNLAGVRPSAPELTPAALTSPRYDEAVGDLLRVLESGRGSLHPRTIAVLERNLTLIDEAIAEARAALEQDPADVALVAAVARHQRTKLAVLRQVEQLVSLQ